MCVASMLGGAIITQPTGDLRLRVRYRSRHLSYDVGELDLGACLSGPSG
jgi:hypothetical protein